MAGVNGVEITVGQVWRTRGGEVVTVSEHYTCDTAYPWLTISADGNKIWLTNSGRDYESVNSPVDLIELVKDENGFTTWRGGEQPAETHGQEAVVRLRDGPTVKAPADKMNWAPTSANPIVAYKVVEQATTSQPEADSATLAEETLSALGWTFDGQAWVENAVTEMPVGMPDNPVSAPALLTAAAKHMYDRAATYDKPEGERSMAQTVAVFEAYHGIKLTEAQGWHFMQVLKDVRLFTRETYHADSAEDCIAYAALKAEAKAQEGGA